MAQETDYCEEFLLSFGKGVHSVRQWTTIDGKFIDHVVCVTDSRYFKEVQVTQCPCCGKSHLKEKDTANV